MRFWPAILMAAMLFLPPSAWSQGLSGSQTTYSEEEVKRIRTLANLGDVESQFILGSLYEGNNGVGQDSSESLRWDRMAAEQGHIVAQVRLGYKYMIGWGGIPKDRIEGLHWLRLGVEQGESLSELQAILGQIYYEGEPGIPQDFAEAAHWYRLAAENGNADAQAALGQMYWTGKGVSENSSEASRWLQLAAKQGHGYAQLNLAALYLEKFKTHASPDDAIMGHMWAALALNNDYAPLPRYIIIIDAKHDENGEAEKERVMRGLARILTAGVFSSRLEESMSADDILEAQRRARECYKSDYQDCGYTED